MRAKKKTPMPDFDKPDHKIKTPFPTGREFLHLSFTYVVYLKVMRGR